MSNIIHFNDLKLNNCSFSTKLYEKNQIKYKFSSKLSDFLIKPIQKGIEVGSNAYSYNKTYKFIRTADISNDAFVFDNKSSIGVSKVFFKENILEKNQILIVKDGSLGNVSILGENYSDCMISAGINVLTLQKPFYVFAILQHDLFKKNFEYNITSGSTISHAKDLFLNFDIPLPKNNNKNVIKFIESIVKSIIYKEKLIKDKVNKLNNYISDIINFKGFENIKNIYPTYSDLLKFKRLDSGYYTNKSIFIRKLIESYDEGYFYIPSKNLKGGGTPRIRSNPSKDNLSYKWIIPSYINEIGLNTNIYSMDFTGKNNLNHDACIIINRTSKKSDGQSGKYVGIASFYDYSFFGKGHHNQGFYRLENYNKTDLITFVVLLNHPIYREYFGEISIGSKMKEIKKYNLIEIPFPKFNNKIKNKIKNLYFKEITWNYNNTCEFEEYDKKWCEKAGIFDLYMILYKEKIFLNKIVEKLYNNEDIDLKYEF